MPNDSSPFFLLPLVPNAPVKKSFTAALLGVSSQLLRAANPINRGIVISNRLSATCYVSLTGSPATTDGIPIPAGGVWSWPRGVIQDIYVIAPGLLVNGDIYHYEFN